MGLHGDDDGRLGYLSPGIEDSDAVVPWRRCGVLDGEGPIPIVLDVDGNVLTLGIGQRNLHLTYKNWRKRRKGERGRLEMVYDWNRRVKGRGEESVTEIKIKYGKWCIYKKNK